MARNKYPEETVQKIIEVSLKLFMKKGYEQTSIQDIINELGGLSKGAIYHHFKSKEDILVAVGDHIYQETDALMAAIRDDVQLNGLEKLQKMFRSSLSQSSQTEILSMAPNLITNPKLLVIQLQSTMEVGVPYYIQPVIEQGIADGSLKTQYPKELAEVIMVLSNVWLNPMVFVATPTEALGRCRFFKEMLIGLGVDLIDEDMIHQFEYYAQLYEEKKVRQ